MAEQSKTFSSNSRSVSSLGSFWILQGWTGGGSRRAMLRNAQHMRGCGPFTVHFCCVPVCEVSQLNCTAFFCFCIHKTGWTRSVSTRPVHRRRARCQAPKLPWRGTCKASMDVDASELQSPGGSIVSHTSKFFWFLLQVCEDEGHPAHLKSTRRAIGRCPPALLPSCLQRPAG